MINSLTDKAIVKANILKCNRCSNLTINITSSSIIEKRQNCNYCNYYCSFEIIEVIEYPQLSNNARLLFNSLNVSSTFIYNDKKKIPAIAELAELQLITFIEINHVEHYTVKVDLTKNGTTFKKHLRGGL